MSYGWQEEWEVGNEMGEINSKESLFVRLDGRLSHCWLWITLYLSRKEGSIEEGKEWERTYLGRGRGRYLAHRTWSYVRFRSAASVMPYPPPPPPGSLAVPLLLFLAALSLSSRIPPLSIALYLSPSTSLALLQLASVLKVCVRVCSWLQVTGISFCSD